MVAMWVAVLAAGLRGQAPSIQAADATKTTDDVRKQPADLTPAGLQAMLVDIDERQRNAGDYAPRRTWSRKNVTKKTSFLRRFFFRRAEDERFMILFYKAQGVPGPGVPAH